MAKPAIHGRDHVPGKYGGTATGHSDKIDGMLYLPSASETTGQVLTRDSTAAHGIKWATSSGGTGSGLPCALALAYDRSQSTGVGARIKFDFDDIYQNDAMYGYEVVSGGRARYITTSTEGFYRYDAYVEWNTDFSPGDFPFIEPSCYVLGSDDTLVNAAAVYWADTGGIIYGEQFIASEMDHHQLRSTIYFNFTAADFGAATIGIGVNLVAGASITKNFGAGVSLAMLGDTLSAMTTPFT